MLVYSGWVRSMRPGVLQPAAATRARTAPARKRFLFMVSPNVLWLALMAQNTVPKTR